MGFEYRLEGEERETLPLRSADPEERARRLQRAGKVATGELEYSDERPRDPLRTRTKLPPFKLQTGLES